MSACINSIPDHGEHHLDTHTHTVCTAYTHMHWHTEPWQQSSVRFGSFEVQQKCSNVTALGDRLLAPWHPYYSPSSPRPPLTKPAHLQHHLPKTCTCRLSQCIWLPLLRLCVCFFFISPLHWIWGILQEFKSFPARTRLTLFFHSCLLPSVQKTFLKLGAIVATS